MCRERDAADLLVVAGELSHVPNSGAGVKLIVMIALDSTTVFWTVAVKTSVPWSVQVTTFDAVTTNAGLGVTETVVDTVSSVLQLVAPAEAETSTINSSGGQLLVVFLHVTVTVPPSFTTSQ